MKNYSLDELETDGLILKKYCEDDLANIYSLKAEPLVWRFSTKISSELIEDAEARLIEVVKNYDENKCDFKGLFLKHTYEYIGEAGVLSVSKANSRAVIGYNILPKYWGNNYATEITKALVKYLFEVEELERVEALVAEENKASCSVLEKSGFIKEGCLRNFAYIDNKFVNVYYYGVIKSDYMQL